MSFYRRFNQLNSVNFMSSSIESNKIYFIPSSKKYAEKQPSVDLQTSDPTIPCCVGENCYKDKQEEEKLKL